MSIQQAPAVPDGTPTAVQIIRDLIRHAVYDDGTDSERFDAIHEAMMFIDREEAK